MRAVTLYPGSKEQVGVIDILFKTLNISRKNIPIGAFNSNHPKPAVSKFHYTVFPDIKPREPDGTGEYIIKDILAQYPDTIVITGGPPFNLQKVLENNKDLKLDLWIGQGKAVK